MGNHQTPQGRARTRSARRCSAKLLAGDHCRREDRRRPESRQQRIARGRYRKGEVLHSLPKDKIDVAMKRLSRPARRREPRRGHLRRLWPCRRGDLREALTDNRNRTAADVRSAFTRAGGTLPRPAPVAFQFERKGQISPRQGGSTRTKRTSSFSQSWRQEGRTSKRARPNGS